MLGRQALKFAAVLTDIVNRTVASDALFVVTPLAGDGQAWIFPEGSTPSRVVPIPLTVGVPEGAEAPLWLRASFRVALDRSQEHLAVEQSVFGLCVNPATNRCVVRLEYDRDLGHEPGNETSPAHRRPAAHVQIHGESAELSYALGRLGRKLEPLEKLHIPVGGRRFRPTLEDFIEFLECEGLLPGVKTGWRDAIAEHRNDWLRAQLRAAVRNDPHVAAEQLRKMNWQVDPPPVR